MTLAEAATSCEAMVAVVEILSKLTQSEMIEAQQIHFRAMLQRFGKFARYADLSTALWAAAKFVEPRSYLEIGVRTGRSAAIVGAVAPDCAIHGFDLWIRDYFVDPVLGPDFVRDELRAVGHRGPVELVSGDSRESLPDYLSKHPDLFFDLIAIDGDKTLRVASSDYANALPRLKIGGIVVTDDLAFAPSVLRVWREMVARDSRYVKWQLADTGSGLVGLAIRIADDPWRLALRFARQ